VRVGQAADRLQRSEKMFTKNFKIPRDQLKPVATGYGACLATDHIVVDGKKVGFMHRDPPQNPTDSGWRFFSGEETQTYIDDPRNLAFYDVNTVANYDLAIIPHLAAPVGSAFVRISGTQRFKADKFAMPGKEKPAEQTP